MVKIVKRKMIINFSLFMIVWLGMGFYSKAGEVPSMITQQDGYIHQESFLEDKLLSGIADQEEVYFAAGDWEIREAFLTMYYTVTPLAEGDISDFTVYLNQSPVFSEKLPVKNQGVQGIKILLPPGEVKKGTNTLMIRSYIRTSKEKGCSDEVSGAAWMQLRKESAVTLSYTPRKQVFDIASFYTKFLSMEALENGESGIYLPENSSDLELSLLANAVVNIAGKTGFTKPCIDLEIMKENIFMDQHDYHLMIAEFSNLPQTVLGWMTKEQKEQAKQSAVMLYLMTSEGNHLLLIAGSDPAALLNSVRVLGNDQYMKQMASKEKKFDEYPEGLTETKKANEFIPLQERYVQGPYRQVVSYFMEEGAGTRMGAGTKVKLVMRYSDNLDFDRSMVTVMVNDVPAGSKKLSKQNVDEDLFLLEVPEDARVTGVFNLQVVFDLEIKDMDCTVRREDMPWAYVSGDSKLQLKAERAFLHLFEYLPAPYMKEGRFNQTAVVLPENPDMEELKVMADILFCMGRFQTQNTGQLQVKTGGYSEDLKESNLIVIGIKERNFFAREFNDQLYFSFSPGATTIVPNEKMAIEPSYGAKLGTVQLLDSPFSDGEKSVMLVSGITKKGLINAASYLTSSAGMQKLYGDGYVADAESIYCFRFGEDNEKNEGLQEETGGNNDSLDYVFLGGMIIILMIVILLFLISKYNDKGKGAPNE